jgi:1A family penicillin-binding protein
MQLKSSLGRSGKKDLFFVRLMKFLVQPAVRYTILFLMALSLITITYILRDLPSPRKITHQDNFAVSTQILDRHGTPLYEIFGSENRTPVKLDSLPPHVSWATISVEDKNFYQHFGFDLRGITRAVINNFRGQRIEGGSTITQQLIKNALLSSERSYKRKVKEAILAIFTEVIYTKEEILEMYLNYISYGGTAVGIEAASQSYFDKSATELSIGEAALLAGLPQAPSRYSPFGSNPEAAKSRQHDVLRRMREDGYISAEEEEQAKAEVLQFALSTTDIKAPHFVFYVRDLLYEEYGVTTVERGGLRVTTTLDLDLHNIAQASLSAEIDNLKGYQVGNGAALIIKPNTGEILSMIGSKDYFNATAEGQVNVTLAQRQPGSSIKPLMYASAFQEKVLNPGTILIDTPTCFQSAGQPPYCPKNYSGGFRGPVTVRQSLGNSLNITAVKALRILGMEKFINQAKALGITSWQDHSRYGWSLTLGGGEVRMIDLAQAFASLANQGVKVPLTPILKVEDYTGKEIKQVDTASRKEALNHLTNNENDKTELGLERVMDREPAYLVSHILQDNDARSGAFGSRSELVIPDQIVSVKTGTTNDLKDNWTVGYTPEYLVITWVGNNDGSPMNRSLVSGITGAAPIFNDIMSYVLKDQESVWQEKPADVTEASVCASGMPPGQGRESCSAINKEYYWKESKPSGSKIVSQDFWIDPKTGLPPPFGEQVDGLVLENHKFYQDPITELYCADCNRAVNESGQTVYEQNIIDEGYQVNEQRYFSVEESE